MRFLFVEFMFYFARRANALSGLLYVGFCADMKFTGSVSDPVERLVGNLKSMTRIKFLNNLQSVLECLKGLVFRNGLPTV
jgi:hypothetical protein